MEDSAQNKAEILILGGGFGGVVTAKYLLRKLLSGFHVTLVDRHDYQDFHADLYEVASSWMEEKQRNKHEYHDVVGTVSLSFKDIFGEDKRISTVASEIKDIDLKSKKVLLSSGKTLKYDYLVIALGSETNYFGIPKLEEYSFTLKSVSDAMNLRNAVEEKFFDPSPSLNILIGGGGFTGVELAAELTNFVRKICRNKDILETSVTITILEATDSILGGAEPWAKKAASKRLERLGVKIKLSSPIKNVSKNEVELSSGEKLKYDILAWTAGIKANKLLAALTGVEMTKVGSILVDEYLRAKNFDDVFVVGDSGTFLDKNGKSSPPTAQKAILEGKLVAGNIASELLDYPQMAYKPKNPAFFIPLGGKYALGKIGPLKVDDFLGWAIREYIAFRYFFTVLPFSKALHLWLNGVKVFERNDS